MLKLGLRGILIWMVLLLPFPLWADSGKKEDDKKDKKIEDRMAALEKELAQIKSQKSQGSSIWVVPKWLGVGLGGQYRIMGNASNFGWHAKTLTRDQTSTSFINQRFRTWLNLHEKQAKNVGVYFQLEIGHNMWGDDREGPKTHRANGNEVGLELRRGFLWLKFWKSHLLRVGVQSFHDRFGEKPDFQKDWLFSVDQYDSFGAVLANSIWDFNVGGISLEGSFKKSYHYRLGWYLLGGGTTFTGRNAANLLASDLDIELGNHLFGGSLYYLRDKGDYSYGNFGGPKTAAGYDHAWDLWAGLRGHISFSKQLLFSFFIIYNHGEVAGPLYIHNGWAFKGALTANLKKAGTIRFQTIYSTGSKNTRDSSSFRTIAQSERDDLGSQGYWSFLGLTSPWGPSDVKDLGVSLQNQGLGLLTIQASYEKGLTSFLTGYLGLGWLQSASPNPNNDKKDMGLEVFLELTWTINKIVNFKTGFSYFMTGDFYKASTGVGNPDDLYEAYFRMQIEF
ncbi:MAG: hypothetical protein D6785_11890 [Planctomycetota bacterium]|nr:MAG: hypothetical protein D6785_11890 [Planctomycetota bacterium]